MDLFDLYDFADDGVSVIQTWAKRENLSVRSRARLNQKLDRLVQMDFRLAQGTKLLAGPVGGHIYKLRIFADVMLRPHLCRGPLAVEGEYTLLQGAIEDIGQLHPHNCLERAEINRKIVESDPARRILHESIK